MFAFVIEKKLIRYRNALFIPNIEIRRGGGEDPAFRSTSHLQHKSYYSHTNEKKFLCNITLNEVLAIYFLFIPIIPFVLLVENSLASTLGVLKCMFPLYTYSVKVPFVLYLQHTCIYSIYFNWNSCCCCLIKAESDIEYKI